MTPEVIGGIISILGLLGALIKVWTKVGQIQAERLETASRRDGVEVELRDKVMKNENLMNYRIEQLEKHKEQLTECIKELQNSIMNLQISVNSLVIEIKSLKDGK